MKKFDIIIPIGCSCMSAIGLRENKKRSRSFPLDWITPTSLGKAVDFIENHFQDFFNKQDFVRDPENDNRKNISYVNTRTKLSFFHDFKDENKFDEEYVALKEKYDRRIERIYTTIRDNRDILFLHVYISQCFGKQPDTEEIKREFARLQALFPKNNMHLLFVLLGKEGKGFAKKALTDKIDYVECYGAEGADADTEKLDYCKYRSGMNLLLKDYPVKRNWKDYFRKLGYKTLDALCKLLPAKKLKEKIRMMYKEYK